MEMYEMKKLDGNEVINMLYMCSAILIHAQTRHFSGKKKCKSS